MNIKPVDIDVQVVLLLYLANWLVHLLWRRGSDPDNSAIPYLTAMGDLLGTVLLALAFFVLTLISQHMSSGHHKVEVICCGLLCLIACNYND